MSCCDPGDDASGRFNLDSDTNSIEMNPERRRFLLVGDLPPPVHGQSLSFEMLCRELPDRGFDSRVVNLSRKKASPWSRVSMVRLMEVCIGFFRFVAGLARNYRRVYILIAQSRAGFMRDMLMIWSAWICGCRIVAHLRAGNYDGFYRGQPKLWQFLIRHTLRRVHRIIALSERLRDMYAFDPALGERVVVVMNGPPMALKGKPRHRDAHADRPLRLLFLSNLIQLKGYHDALEAMTILRRMTPMPFEAIFAGDFQPNPGDKTMTSPEKAEAEFLERIGTSGLSNVVCYAGPVTGEAKWRLLETSDFFLLPTYFEEGQPISIIEAMAHGCIVVTTKFRSAPDLVVDGETGVLVDQGQPMQIADAVLRIATDVDKFNAMSRAAVECYERNFTKDRHMDAMVSALTTV